MYIKFKSTLLNLMNPPHHLSLSRSHLTSSCYDTYL
jgi:hypothetical protein